MEGLAVLLIIAGVGALLCGPIALIISIIALTRTKQTYPEPRISALKPSQVLPIIPKTTPAVREARQEVLHKPAEEPAAARISETVKKPFPVSTQGKAEKKEVVADKVKISFSKVEETAGPALSLEQRIGTQWVLIAGVITVFVGVGFFLKYAYDNDLIGPLGRVIIAFASGLVAIVIGEITRRRGYDIVAKGVTALGFALLYAADFSAYRYYGLIGSTPAFAIAIVITLSSMFYAVALDEILAAFLALLGGYLTPVIVSTGENLPGPLFSYVLVLSVGAILCAYYRKWGPINLLAYIGTFLLYTGWFEKFFRQQLRLYPESPQQMAVALGWLGVFFGIYLVLPILYGLVRKVKAHKHDVLLVLINAMTTFYFLWTILHSRYRTELAVCAVGLCVAHLVMMGVAFLRCRDDLNLRQVLLAISLFFLTIAIPLYLKMNVIVLAWAIEGALLMIIGLRYRSILTQAGGAVALALSIGKLLSRLPMHTGAFKLILNPEFGTWVLVAGVLYVCHLIYRKSSESAEEPSGVFAEAMYAAAVLGLMAAAIMEWYQHCDYNIEGSAISEAYFIKGVTLLFTVFTLLFVVRSIRPRGKLCRALAVMSAAVGSVFTMIAFTEFHKSSFVIFANRDFAIALVFVAMLFAVSRLFRIQEEDRNYSRIFVGGFALAGLFVLWILLTEEIYQYWYCRNRYIQTIANWRFLANMYISVMWALYGIVLMVIGFVRRINVLRYIALGLFAILLGKVFLIDMSMVKSGYRITAFLATGLTLVGVSYLYQFLKKKGFFEAMLSAAERSIGK